METLLYVLSFISLSISLDNKSILLYKLKNQGIRDLSKYLITSWTEQPNGVPYYNLDLHQIRRKNAGLPSSESLSRIATTVNPKDQETSSIHTNKSKKLNKKRKKKTHYVSSNRSLKKFSASKIKKKSMKSQYKSDASDSEDLSQSNLRRKLQVRAQETTKKQNISKWATTASWMDDCYEDPFGICTTLDECPAASRIPLGNSACEGVKFEKSLVCCMESDVKDLPPDSNIKNSDQYKNENKNKHTNENEDKHTNENEDDSSNENKIKHENENKNEHETENEDKHENENNDKHKHDTMNNLMTTLLNLEDMNSQENGNSSRSTKYTISFYTYTRTLGTTLDYEKYWINWEKKKMEEKKCEHKENSLDSWERWKEKRIKEFGKKDKEENKKNWFKFDKASWENFKNRPGPKCNDVWFTAFEKFLRRQYKKMQKEKKTNNNKKEQSNKSKKKKFNSRSDYIDWSQWKHPADIKKPDQRSVKKKIENELQRKLIKTKPTTIRNVPFPFLLDPTSTKPTTQQTTRIFPFLR